MKKSALIFGGNALIVVIYVLNFAFKMQFLGVSKRKNRRFYPEGPFFLVFYMIAYQSALISRKLRCPKNFLVNAPTTLVFHECFAIGLYTALSFIKTSHSINCSFYNPFLWNRHNDLFDLENLWSFQSRLFQEG